MVLVFLVPIGAFVGDMCVGSSESNGGPIQIAVMGDDTDSPEVDGALDGDIVTLILQNSDGVYVTETSFVYALNAIEIVEDLSFDFFMYWYSRYSRLYGWSLFRV